VSVGYFLRPNLHKCNQCFASGGLNAGGPLPPYFYNTNPDRSMQGGGVVDFDQQQPPPGSRPRHSAGAGGGRQFNAGSGGGQLGRGGGEYGQHFNRLHLQPRHILVFSMKYKMRIL